MQKFIEKIVNNKKLFITVICSLVLIISVCCIGIVLLLTDSAEGDLKAGEEELVLSADFNKDLCGFLPEAWAAASTDFQYQKNGGIEDSGCVKVSNALKNDARYQMTIDVKEKSYYKISGWVKTDGIGAAEGAAGANISVLNNFEKYEYVYGTEDWKYIEFYGKTADGQETCTVALRVGFYSGDNTGTAWFDNIKVSRVSDVPKGNICLNFKETLKQSAASDDEEKEDETPLDENFYSDMTKAAVFLTIFVFLAFLIAYRFSRAYDGFGRKKPLEAPTGGAMSLAKGVIAVMVIGLIIRVALAFTPLQCSVDVNIFKYWGNQIVSGGFTETYVTLKDSIDYPPLYVYFLFAASSIKDLFAGSEYQDMIYSFLIKLTPIIADCLIGFFIYKICDKRMRSEWKVFAVAAWMFNPVVIIDSAVWGQVDSVLALFVLATIYFALEKKYLLSGIALGLGVMLKPQAIIVAPILFFMLLKYVIQEKDEVINKVKSFGFTALGFIGGAVLPCLPFMFKMGMVETEIFGKTLNIPWILSLFVGTANHYSYASVNSLNFWFLLGKNWVHDSNEIGWITLLTWGMAAIVLICIVIWVFYFLYKKKSYLSYVFAGILYLCVTMFGPRMHERYFFPAVAFFAVAFVLSNNRIWLWIYSAISVFGFLTIAEVLLDLEVGRYLESTGAETARYAHFLWVEQTGYRNVIAIAMVLIAIASLILAILTVFDAIGNNPRFENIWKISGEEYPEKNKNMGKKSSNYRIKDKNYKANNKKRKGESPYEKKN